MQSIVNFKVQNQPKPQSRHNGKPLKAAGNRSGRHRKGARTDRSSERRMSKRDEAAMHEICARLRADASSARQKIVELERANAKLRKEVDKLSTLVEWERSRRIQEEGEHAFWKQKAKYRRRGGGVEPF